MCRALDGHVHQWDVDVKEWIPCDQCEGTGRDGLASAELDDIRFPDCLECGGFAGDYETVCSRCSVCGITNIDAAMMEGV